MRRRRLLPGKRSGAYQGARGGHAWPDGIMVAHRLSMVTQADVILLFSTDSSGKWGTIRNCWRRAACSTALATLSAGAALGAGWNTGEVVENERQ